MSKTNSISWDVCTELFPLTFCIDKSGIVQMLSPSLGKLIGQDVVGELFFDHLSINSPEPWHSGGGEYFQKHKDNLILFHTKNNAFAFRGQVIDGWHGGHEAYLLVCTPWMNWIRNKVGDVRLDPSLFPILDSQLDLELSTTTQTLMQKDLENLTDFLRKAKDKAEDASRAKSQFVSHVSHELRTPLNAISTSVDLLRGGDLDTAQQTELFHVLSSSADTLIEMINNVLDFSKLNEAQYNPVSETFSPEALVLETVRMLNQLALENNSKVQTIVMNRVPRMVSGDTLILRKVLINLVGNAIKHSGSDLIKVLVTMGETEDGRNCLMLRVRDYGIGIDKNELATIFEDFQTGSSRNLGSTGLGLAITRRLLNHVGGEICVDSEPGRGTCFRLTMPVDISHEVSRPERRTPVRQSTQSLQGQALLVDDNLINLKVGKMLLEKLGLEVSTADSGQAAIDCCRNQQFDLIYMDINMPDMSGIDATRKIHALPGLDALPVLALTANVSPEDLESYLGCGMQGVLLKPMDKSKVIELTAEILSAADSASDNEGHKPADTVDAVCNMRTLGELLAGVGADDANEVLEIYLEASNRLVSDIDEALRSKDASSARAGAHKLASTALTYGLEQFGNWLRKIELLRDADIINQAESFLTQLTELHIASLTVLESIDARGLIATEVQALTCRDRSRHCDIGQQHIRTEG